MITSTSFADDFGPRKLADLLHLLVDLRLRGFFAQTRPFTGEGKLALAKVLAANGDAGGAALLVRAAWHEDELSPDSEKDLLAALSAEQKPQHEALGKQIDEIGKQKRLFTHALLVTDAQGPPPQTKLLFQGDYRKERQPIEPGFISILDPNLAAIRKPRNNKTTGRRLALAEWK